MIETTIMLKPAAEWRKGMTRQKIVAELTEKLTHVPGYIPGFLQPIENRILMISTGIRAQLGVKIAGRRQDGWRVREQHGARVRFGGPEHRTLASIQRRRDEKIAVPISDGVRASGKDGRPPRSPSDSWDCA